MMFTESVPTPRRPVPNPQLAAALRVVLDEVEASGATDLRAALDRLAPTDEVRS